MTFADLQSEGTAPVGPETPSDKPAEAGLFEDVPGAPSADPHDEILARIAELPPEKVAAYLEQKVPDKYKAATKDIRQRDIDLRAAKLAEKEIEAARQEAARSKAMLEEMALAREDEVQSRMTDEERRERNGKIRQQIDQRQVQTAAQRAAAAERYIYEIENKRAHELLVNHLAEEAELDESAKEDLRQAKDSNDLQARLVKLVTAKAKAMQKQGKSQDERNAALERRDSGASIFAATSGGSSGGELSMADLEARYATMSSRDPDWARLDREYTERKARGSR